MKYEDLPQRWKFKIEEYLASKGIPNMSRFNAGSFPLNTIVKIKFEDGSFAEFRYAIVIEAREFNEVGLFTEHCGYHIFALRGTQIEVVPQIWKDIPPA